MSSANPSRQQAGLAKGMDESLRNVIAEQVIHRLSQPKNMLAIHIHKLWTDRYRANVFVGANFATSTLLRSFFLVTDGDGNITQSTPTIAHLD